MPSVEIFKLWSNAIITFYEFTLEWATKHTVVSRDVLQAWSGIRRALIKNIAAGKIFHSSIESGFKMAINSGQSGLHVKFMMDPYSL